MARPKGGYFLNGTRIPSVTTITGRYKDSGGLLHWAFNQGKDAIRQCSECGHKEGEIERLYDKRDEAADAGTIAHDMVECHIRGQQFEYPKDAAPLVRDLAGQAFESYLNWAETTKLEIIETEMSLVSDRFAYGGTLDALGVINGDIVLLDWKTSKDVYTDFTMQLAAYGQLVNEKTGYQINGGFHLCKFSKESASFSHHYWAELDLELKQFLLLREAYDNDKLLKKRV